MFGTIRKNEPELPEEFTKFTALSFILHKTHQPPFMSELNPHMLQISHECLGTPKRGTHEKGSTLIGLVGIVNDMEPKDSFKSLSLATNQWS
ncbi:hypothetical protein TNCT_209971 [Trichonephila clavata]|uniref:Uncharacterized protein n=1 Tax=Trichonephila clavata TaxID=2740835 RepID=A0A8X6F2G7_TRICU|nr:hypothetical protein TNCT_209971 [Trichonephila clavata]